MREESFVFDREIVTENFEFYLKLFLSQYLSVRRLSIFCVFKAERINDDKLNVQRSSKGIREVLKATSMVK